MSNIKSLLSLLFCFGLQAANHYVLDGGSGTGAAWDDAWDALPSTLVRGDTYYIGDGAYASYTFNDAASGATLITIKKATATDHGTATGWNASYGDGQAVWSGPLYFTTAYWLFDGQEYTTSTSGHGFKVVQPTPSGQGINVAASYVEVRYVEIQGNGPDDAGSPADDGYYSTGNRTYNTVAYCYIHDQGRCQFILRGNQYFLCEYTVMARNETIAAQHSEAVSLYLGAVANNTFRYNTLIDIEGTGGIMVGDATDCYFYGNVVYWTTNYPWAGQDGTYFGGNGSIGSWTSETISNSKFYNNTVIIPASGGLNYGIGNMLGSAGTNNVSQNNLYVCDGTIGTRLYYDDGTAHDYNAYSGGNSEGEANEQTNAVTALFTDFAGYDFTLASGTTNGNTLAAPYDLDPTDAIRGDDGTWDRGAYEFDAGGGGGDTAAPYISSVAFAAARQSAVATFVSDESAYSGLWGTNYVSGLTFNVTNAVLMVPHTITVPDLAPGATYYVQIYATDISGNSTNFAAGSFTTLRSVGNATTLRVGTLTHP